jgi:uncharacterized protein YciI
MEKIMYMMMIEKSKTYNKVTKKVIVEHVENIRRLDDEGKLEICGVFKGYPGMAGMYILKTESLQEAEEICQREPLVVGGYATFKLVTLQIADRETIICCDRHKENSGGTKNAEEADVRAGAAGRYGYGGCAGSGVRDPDQKGSEVCPHQLHAGRGVRGVYCAGRGDGPAQGIYGGRDHKAVPLCA